MDNRPPSPAKVPARPSDLVVVAGFALLIGFMLGLQVAGIIFRHTWGLP